MCLGSRKQEFHCTPHLPGHTWNFMSRAGGSVLSGQTSQGSVADIMRSCENSVRHKITETRDIPSETWSPKGEDFLSFWAEKMGQVFRPGVNGLGANWDPSPWRIQAVFGSPIQGPCERNSQTRKKGLGGLQSPSRPKFCDSIQAAVERWFNVSVENYIIYIDIHTYMWIKQTQMSKVVVFRGNKVIFLLKNFKLILFIFSTKYQLPSLMKITFNLERISLLRKTTYLWADDISTSSAFQQ